MLWLDGLIATVLNINKPMHKMEAINHRYVYILMIIVLLLQTSTIRQIQCTSQIAPKEYDICVTETISISEKISFVTLRQVTNTNQLCSVTVTSPINVSIGLQVDNDTNNSDRYVYVEVENINKSCHHHKIALLYNTCRHWLNFNQFTIFTQSNPTLHLNYKPVQKPNVCAAKSNCPNSTECLKSDKLCSKPKLYSSTIRGFYTYFGWKCNFICPLNCSCTLTSREVQVCDKWNSYLVVYPTGLQRLTWSQSRLATIGYGSFKTLKLLQELHLSKNGLKTLERGCFKGLLHLQLLNLRENNIDMLYPGVLNDLIKLSHLYLRGNNIRQIQRGTFDGLREMIYLELSHNRIEDITQGTFQGLPNLRKLFLVGNKIKLIEPGSWNPLQSLDKLVLQNNLLADLYLHNLWNVTRLFLANNRITTIRKGTFRTLSKLQGLSIDSNNISKIENGAFDGLKNLIFLSLDRNDLQNIYEGSFAGLKRLEVLFLNSSQISRLPSNICDDLIHLKIIYLQDNKLDVLPNEAFSGCTNLETVDLKRNPLMWVSREDFVRASNKARFLVEYHSTCCFIQTPDKQCVSLNTPPTFLTCKRLLSRQLIQICMWILGITAIIANAFVLYWRKSHHRQQGDKSQSLLIAHLSASDLLMGIYMLIIASSDIYFGEAFPSHAEQWRQSHLCKLAGAISLLSNEVSILFITLISIDRYKGVTAPFSRSRSGRRTKLISFLIWIFGLSLCGASIAIAEISPEGYDLSEVCIGLPMSRQWLVSNTNVSLSVSDGYTNMLQIEQATIEGSVASMYFSIIIYTGLNLLCCIIVTFCYTSIFVTIRKSREESNRPRQINEEYKLASKMAAIVLTDLLCWSPIVVISILIQAGVVTLSPVLYAWIVAFVLPINSSVNPFLYTIITIRSARKEQRERRTNGPIGLSRTQATEKCTSLLDAPKKPASSASETTTSAGVSELLSSETIDT